MSIPNIDYVDNDEYEHTGELYSLHLALESLADSDEDLIITYGDVLFKRYILEALMDAEEDFVAAVDTGWRESANRNRSADHVSCSMPNVRQAYHEPVELKRVAVDIEPENIHGEWMGILKVRAAGRTVLRELVAELVNAPDGSGRKMKMPELLNVLIEQGSTIRTIYTAGHWLDVDSVEDVVASGSFG